MFAYFRSTLVPNEAVTKIMKLIARGLWVILLFLGSQQFVAAQVRRQYLDPQYQQVKDSTVAKFIRTIELQADSLYHVRDIYRKGQLAMEGTFVDKDCAIQQGYFTYYFENGIKESEGNYKRGSKVGYWKRWDFKGNPKPDRFYPDEYKQRQNRTTKGASFPGGTAALQRFLTDSLAYPDEAFDRQIEGIVYVTFIIDQEGDVRNAEISHGVHYLLDDEALRIVGNMPTWSPASRNGMPVESSFIMPVTFDLKSEGRSRGVNLPSRAN